MGGGTVSCCMAIYEVWGISWVVERVISQVNFIYFLPIGCLFCVLLLHHLHSRDKKSTRWFSHPKPNRISNF